MSNPIYCKYCHHNWKHRKEYDKHINCCEYFYHQRRNPQPEMDEHGTKIPSNRELFRYVQELSVRLEKTEKELARLRNSVNTRQRKAIIEWLNQPHQKPEITFEDWWMKIKATEENVMRVVSRDLTEGIKSCIQTHLASNAIKLPIRCFTQKPGTFYVYSRECGTAQGTKKAEPNWRILGCDQLGRMATHISQAILREFLEWQKKCSRIEDQDERAMDKTLSFMMKINGNGVSIEKRMVEIKKWLFPQLEENLRVMAECDFE